MKINLSLQLRAFLLLIVFSLSTVVSFACAVGIDMGYNENHHQKPSSHGHPTSQTENKKDHHDGVIDHEIHDNPASQQSPDDCCKDEAEKFEKCDKRSLQISNYKLQVPVLILLSVSDFHTDFLTTSQHNPHSKYQVRNHHPPIPDTRIAIQSFLI